ncbi:MAG TPA: DNA/RNA nuclease SfsA [Deltaproteobacteria bacterium]|nr:DNA/RNA nuclease SfsA [Deltaproteobacteria bacterium]HCP45789.1 DNA/RNA nuclease SfsA [Deltaproteobacteria bacterium]
MKFSSSLVPGVLLRREKRFIVHVRLADGSEVVAHTNNSGSMLGCSEPGSPVWLSPADRPERKLKWTWELVAVGPAGVLVGINTALPNQLVQEGTEQGVISELQGYTRIRREVRYGAEGSRIDLLLDDEQRAASSLPSAWVEVKNVTLAEGGRARFPDAVTVRGRKHLRELEWCVRQGDRGVLVFVVQRADVHSVTAADDIDPDYGHALRRAVDNGVTVLAYRAQVTLEEVCLVESLPVCL